MPWQHSIVNQRRINDIVETLGGPHRDDRETINFEGARRRPRVYPGKAVQPFLTERQRTVLKGKVRVRAKWGRVIDLMEETGMTIEEFVETLSNEELARGQIKNKNGKFSGRPPQWVPRAFHRACIAELMRRGKTLWQENYIQAIEVMTEIMKDRRWATPRERLTAAQFVIERLEGKIPEKLIVDTNAPWQVVIDGIVADVSDEAVARGQALLNGARELEQELVPIVEGEVEDVKDHRPTRREAARARLRAQRNGRVDG